MVLPCHRDGCMAITVLSNQTLSQGGGKGAVKETAGGSPMLQSSQTSAMPARTGGQGGQAILASSQHNSWHHQQSEYSKQ